MTSRFSLHGFIAECRDRVDAGLAAWLPEASQAPVLLHEAMRYAVLSGGKRLRPSLAFAAARAVCGDVERALPAAIAVELVHAYSLVHDDLPAMDDDCERRGRPTVHVKFGEAIAILAGDALLTSAFGRLASSDVPSDQVAALVGQLATAAGSGALVGGQVDDLQLAPQAATWEEIRAIHLRKTAALFHFALAAGARLAGATDTQIDALARYGRAYGLAFQAADDVLDGDRSETSLLLVATPAEIAERVQDDATECLAALDVFGPEAEPLRALARDLVERIR